MKKLLAILLIFSSVSLVLSLIAYSSTSNTIPNRLLKLPPESINIYKSDDSGISSEKTVNGDVYEHPSEALPVSQEENQLSEEPDKVVYITIDDGPNKTTTPLYLEALEKSNVNATFFMIGSKMKSRPDLVRAIAAQGNVIGNHSYTHDYASVYKSVYSLEEEITKTQEIIYELAGSQPKIFRAPGGSTKLMKTHGLVNKIDEMGYAFFDWNVSTADTSPREISKEEAIYNVEAYSKGLKRIIVLMHDNGRKASPEALPELIQWFRENGYAVRTLNESVKPVYLSKKVAALQADSGY